MSVQYIRDLSSYEQYFYNFTRTGDENVIGLGKLEAKNENSLDLTSNIVKKTLYFLFKRHPFFRANVKKDKNNLKYYFEVYDETSRSEEMMEYEYIQLDVFNQNLLVDEFENFLSKPYDYENNCLLWRLKLISYKENNKNIYSFAFSFPLYITDGINISTICMEFSNIINSLILNQECEEMKVRLPFIESLHSLVEKQNLYNKEAVDKLIIEEKLVQFNFPYVFRTLNTKSERKTKMNLLKIDAGITGEIIKQSKERKIRLTGFLTTIGLKSLKQLYREFNLEIQRDYSCFLAANLRFRLNPSIDFCDMGLLVVPFTINLFYPKINFENDNNIEQLWENAKYINEIIAEKTKFENGSLLQYSHNFTALAEGNRVFEEIPLNQTAIEINRSNFCDFLLSNLGTYASDRKKLIDGDYKLTEIYHGDCLQSNPSNFSAFMLHVCTFNNQFMFQLSTNRNIFGPEYADRFMEIFKLNLEKSSRL